MSTLHERLSLDEIVAISKPGLYADGNGLYLQVRLCAGGIAKSWIFRFRCRGHRRDMGLGSITTCALQDARDRVKECKLLLRDGIDPIDARRVANPRASSKGPTFRNCAERYIASHRASWKNAKHAAQWSSTLNTYVHPMIGNLHVRRIDTALVASILRPIWLEKTETASRVRNRVEIVLDWARVQGLREGENPARWRGHLDKLFPAPRRIRKTKHHAALPFVELPAFMIRLRSTRGVAARALEFLILTAARTAEAIALTFDEIDGDIWTVPGNRMKSGREHRVPLCLRARAIVVEMETTRTGRFVFAGRKRNKPLSNMALLTLLKRMGRSDLTAHGFRSTFKDWVAECTDYSSELSSLALAHLVDDRVEAAYRRGDQLRKRATLMSDWESYCAVGWSSGEQTMCVRHHVLSDEDLDANV